MVTEETIQKRVLRKLEAAYNEVVEEKQARGESMHCAQTEDERRQAGQEVKSMIRYLFMREALQDIENDRKEASYGMDNAQNPQGTEDFA